MNLTDPLSIIFFAVGLAFGSFSNVLIYRLPRGGSVLGRSRCPKCRKVLGITDLVPLISFVVLKSRCRYCGESISPIYPSVELSCAALFLIALFLIPESIVAASLLAIALWLLFTIAVIDAQTQGIPDVLNFSFVSVAIIFAAYTQSISIWGPLLAAGFFAAQWIFSSGKWVGSGDIILAAGIGFLLSGWQLVLVAIALSYIIGALLASWLLITKRRSRKDRLPFGPFLVIGTMIVMLWGEGLLGLFV